MTIRNRIPLKPLEIWENADVPAALDLEEKIIEKRDLNKSQEVVVEEGEPTLFPEKAYTIKEVSKFLDVSLSTVYRLLDQKAIRYVKHVNKRKILQSDLSRYVEELRKKH
jgi:excisionase family DNA binding protein